MLAIAVALVRWVFRRLDTQHTMRSELQQKAGAIEDVNVRCNEDVHCASTKWLEDLCGWCRSRVANGRVRNNNSTRRLRLDGTWFGHFTESPNLTDLNEGY